MPRKPLWPPPIYVRNGKEYTVLRPGGGQRRDVTLGPVGSPEARAAYARLVAECEALAGAPPPRPGRPTLAEVLVPYLHWAADRYDHRQPSRLTLCALP